MPGSSREVSNAIEEGVEFIWLTSPKSFIGDTKVEAVEVNKMKLGNPDSSGRRRPEIEAGSEYNIKTDLVIKSLGFDPEKHRITYINLSEGDYWDYAAHDFILTRNGHGAGFWDGDWSEPIATKLTELCKKFGEIEIYLSDENLLEAY